MRLANYSIRLDVADNTAEEDLDRMCRALSLLDLRAALEKVLAAYTQGNRVLREVEVTVDE